MTDSGKLILLVEDDENDVFFFRRALKKAGLEIPIRLVTDGEQALQYFNGDGQYRDRAAHPLPDIIFLDLKLPYLSGMDVLEHIQKQPALNTIDVIVLTSSPEERDRKRAFELGAKEYLVKPAAPKTLLQILDRLMQPRE
jgi:Response regulators consisting of a CheY-like receiver domain and a winged-helix DNA-binding domain